MAGGEGEGKRGTRTPLTRRLYIHIYRKFIINQLSLIFRVGSYNNIIIMIIIIHTLEMKK